LPAIIEEVLRGGDLEDVTELKGQGFVGEKMTKAVRERPEGQQHSRGEKTVRTSTS
jgi:hypothetical protein